MRALAIGAALALAACSGDDGGAMPCPNPMDSTCTQTVPVVVQLAGSGTVTSAPAGIDCGTDCDGIFPQGSVVTLTATPDSGFVFTGWSGGCGGTGPCTLTVVAPVTAIAEFAPFCEDACASGSSECVGDGAERTCGDLDGDGCREWGPSMACEAGEACSGVACGPVFAVTVTRTGPGSGVVTSAPAGIDCGGDCSESYPALTMVTLTAAALPGSVFAGWSGGGCTGTGACVLSVTAATAVAAQFDGVCADECTTGETMCAGTGAEAACGNVDADACTEYAAPIACADTELCVATACEPAPLLTVVRTGSGTGAVTSSPAGIACGADCAERYVVGTVVTLTAAPTGGGSFTGWSGGGCSGTGPCVVTIAGPTTVTATFAAACTDTCIAGSAVCAGPGASAACGNADADPCREFMDPVVCGPETACFSTVCEPGFVLRLQVNGPGDVSLSTGDPDCTAGWCLYGFMPGTSVVLTAAADPLAFFAGWSGPCTGTGTCTISSGAELVMAAFAPRCTSTTIDTTTDGGQQQLALDDTRVYWTNFQADTVKRRGKTGGAVVTVSTASNQPVGIAADDTHVYWTSFADDNVVRHTKSTAENTVVVTGQNGAAALAADATHLYWINQLAHTVVRWPKAGGAVEVLASAQAFPSVLVPRTIALDATHVYWTNRGAGTVSRVAKAGGAVEIVVSGAGAATGIAVDATHVYWTSMDTDTVSRAPKTGGAAVVVATTGTQPAGLTLDGGYLYWTHFGFNQPVSRVLATGGVAEDLVGGESGGWDLALDDAGVFFTANTTVVDSVKRLTRSSTCAPPT